MKPSEIGRSYDQIAQRWYDDSFPRNNGIGQHIRALAFVKDYGHALDIGCGCSGRFVDLLIEKGFEVEGVDVSEKMIELARQRHPQIKFHHADICEWELPRQYNFITAWDSIWHIPLHEHQRVLGKMLSGLKPGGVCIFTTGGGRRAI